MNKIVISLNNKCLTGYYRLSSTSSSIITKNLSTFFNLLINYGKHLWKIDYINHNTNNLIYQNKW